MSFFFFFAFFPRFFPLFFTTKILPDSNFYAKLAELGCSLNCRNFSELLFFFFVHLDLLSFFFFLGWNARRYFGWCASAERNCYQYGKGMNTKGRRGGKGRREKKGKEGRRKGRAMEGFQSKNNEKDV